jgi:L-iditol 2-dehydrogenase
LYLKYTNVKTMKALVLESYNNLVYKEVPEPGYGANELLIRVKACGICGSDVHGFDGSTGRRIPPLIMGHEAAGIVEKTGEAVRFFTPGDRVTFDSTIYPLDDWYARRGRYNLSDNRMVLGVSTGEYKRDGAFAEYIVVPEHIAYRLPDMVGYVQAAMSEPAAVATHAINLTPFRTMDSALVVGAGIIGLFLVQILAKSGAGSILVIDPDESKLKMAKMFGARHTFMTWDKNVHEEILSLTNGRGTDIAFEAVGITESVRTAISNVRKGGRVTLVGNLSSSIDFPLQDCVTREIAVQGSCAIAGEYEQVLEMMSTGRLTVEPLISAEAPLSDGPYWFRKLHDKTPGLFKVILKP